MLIVLKLKNSDPVFQLLATHSTDHAHKWVHTYTRVFTGESLLIAKKEKQISQQRIR